MCSAECKEKEKEQRRSSENEHAILRPGNEVKEEASVYLTQPLPKRLVAGSMAGSI